MQEAQCSCSYLAVMWFRAIYLTLPWLLSERICLVFSNMYSTMKLNVHKLEKQIKVAVLWHYISMVSNLVQKGTSIFQISKT